VYRCGNGTLEDITDKYNTMALNDEEEEDNDLINVVDYSTRDDI
jgi:hypothetical protein